MAIAISEIDLRCRCICAPLDAFEAGVCVGFADLAGSVVSQTGGAVHLICRVVNVCGIICFGIQSWLHGCSCGAEVPVSLDWSGVGVSCTSML